MLRLMTRYKRSQNLILVGIIVVLAVGMFIAYGTPSGWSKSGGPKVVEPVADSTVIAEVDGRDITAKDYADGIRRYLAMYQMYRSQSPSAALPTDVKGLRDRGTDKELLRSLVRDKIIEAEAERLALTATEDELRDRIREMYSPDGKWIGYEKFKRAIERQGSTVYEFEQSLRRQITEDKLRKFVTDGIQVSSREIEENYKQSNTKFQVTFTVLEEKSYLDKVQAPTDQEVKAYFDSHKDAFRATKDQRKIQYLFISQEKAGETVPVTDEELRKEYDPEKQVKSIKVKQIVLNVLTPKDEDTVRTKANELVKRARGVDNTPAEDFDALARGNSQDTASAPNGGDLGLVERSNVKPGDVLEQAFSLEVNKVSEPILKNNKFYIFKVTEKTPKTFEEAREALMASVRNRLSYKQASKFADSALNALTQTRDIQKAAAQAAKEMSTKDKAVNPQDLIRTTPFFSAGDDIPEIGSNPSFEESTSALTAKGDIGDKVGVRGGFAIPQLVEIRKPGDPAFEDVKDKVAEKAKKEKALQMAYDEAKKLIAEAKDAAGLKAAAEAKGLKIEEAKDIVATSSLSGRIYPAVYNAAEKAKVGELLPTPFYNSFDSATMMVAVVGVTGRTDADMTKLSEQSKGIEENLRSARAGAMFEAYLDGAKRRLKETGRLIVNQELIERILVTLSQSEAQAPAQP